MGTFAVDEEVWVPTVGYDYYEVSSFGRVRNKNTGRIMKSSDAGGYRTIGLMNNGKSKSSERVHRLVAKAFLENPENKEHVNHKDKNKANNHLSNLEWCSPLENNIHKCLTLVQRTNQNIRIWRVDPITDERLELFNSIQDAAKWCEENGYSSNFLNASANIGYAVRGVYKSSCGFKWVLNEQPHLENEIWTNVKINGNIFDNYFVSNLGRFKNTKGIIMEDYKPHHSGYIIVRVNKQKYPLHRLIASSFLENPENKPVVNHIDGNKTNNCLSNLEWCSVQENCQHNHNVGLIKTFKRKVGQYNLEGELIKEFNSIVDAMKETGVKTIKAVLYKKQNTGGGFIWKYLD